MCVCCALQGTAFRVVSVLITQGVNEMQSIANKLGSTSLQGDINIRGSARLKKYTEACVKFVIGTSVHHVHS